MANNRVTEIDGRLAQLAKERLALTNERISLTSPAPPAQPG